MKNFSRRLCALSMFIILGSCLASAFAQQKTITGTVRDGSGEPITGAIVKATDANNKKITVMTDANGNYSIQAPSGAEKVSASFIGFEPQEVKVGASSKIDLVLKESSTELNEVVAIGYAKVRRKDLTGASVSVSGADIKNIPVTTAAQALQGHAAGVNITTFSGAPGADINIVIRGGTSLTQSNAPLYIVDGFQMDNALKFVDVNDIESIDVLKDASATAIYGAKGSNGVVLITTKSAKKGKTEVAYNGYISLQKLGKSIDVLSPYEYVKLQYEHYLLDDEVDIFETLYGTFDEMHTNYDNAEAIDWLDLMFGGTGMLQNHNVNITSGTDKSRFNLSYNNTTEDALLDKYGMEKNNIRVRLNQELSKKVRLEFSSNFNNTEVDGGGDLGGRLKYAILARPTGGLLYTNEELLEQYGSDEKLSNIDSDLNYDIANPIISNDAITNIKRTRRFDANGAIEIDLAKGLMWKTSGSYFFQQEKTTSWDDGRTLTAETNGGPYGSIKNSEKSSYQITNLLTYNKKINKHDLTLMGGQEVLYNESYSITSESIGFPEGNFELDDMTMGEAQANETSHTRSGIVSFFGRAMYNFNDKYLLTATMRADGSSKFLTGHQWGYFPSASGAWRVLEENFMKNQQVFSNLKLRVGYGASGNCNVDDNMYTTAYESSTYGFNNTEESAFVTSSTLGNKDLQWETVKSTNIGLDMGFLNNRINVSADVYNNVSDNLLMKVPIPATTGYTYQYQNVASVQNRGLELSINSVNITGKDFTWSTDFNIAFNKNKVLELYGSSTDQDYWLYTSGSNGVAYYIKEGQPLGQIYGYAYDGFYTTDDFDVDDSGDYTTLKSGVAYDKSRTRTDVKPGDIKLKANGGIDGANKSYDSDGNPVWTANDREIIGNANPDFTGGITNTFKYKNFDLSIFCNFVYGNDVINLSTQRFVSSYISNQNALSILANRYTTVDPSTGLETKNIERLSTINQNARIWSVNPNVATNVTLNSYYVEDGSYLRINTVTLGYTLSKNLMKRMHISSARVYSTLNNPYTCTNYSGFDPEVTSSSSALNPGIDNSSYPRSKGIVFGLNLIF
jgi:TonB-linked SusC/RagA family outer membrane protein